MQLTQIDQLAGVLAAETRSGKVLIVAADASRSFRLPQDIACDASRVVDVGIAENTGIGVAHGLSLLGFKVFVLGFSSFLVLRGLETIRSYLAYGGSDVIIVGGLSGLSPSHDGYMHQSTDDLGILSAVGGIRLHTPSDRSSLSVTMREVLANPGPQFLRVSRRHIDLGDDATELLAWSPVATRIDRGSNFAVLSYGHLLHECAAAVRSFDGPPGKLIELLQFEPFDEEGILRAIGDTRAVVSVEDHAVHSGLGSRLRALLKTVGRSETALATLGLPPANFGASGEYQDLLSQYGIAIPDIAAAISRVSHAVCQTTGLPMQDLSFTQLLS